MRKQISLIFCLIVLCVAMIFSLSVSAASPLDTAADAGLNLYYQKDEKAFSELEISIYRVAKALPDGTFELIEPFSSYPVNIYDITKQEEWQNIASTLSSYIVADKLAAYKIGKTDETGTAKFEHLETGLYLVREVIAENDVGTYVFNDFMVYLPTPQPDGSFDYFVEAKPKCVNFVPKTEYRVTKLWKDSGKQSERPGQITVDIYKNAELVESQILSASNNWSYTWRVSADDRSEWTVAERSTSDSYTVTVQQNSSFFTIINTHDSDTDVTDSPESGDTTNILPWILIMCFSGIILIITGLYGRRKVAYEKA